MALQDGRVLLTEDKDFGQLVFAANRRSTGVILIGFPVDARPVLGMRVLQAVQQEVMQLAGAFVVLQPRRTRGSRASDG
jgi:predicted nuclease of predicted toxin-antitoxin system